MAGGDGNVNHGDGSYDGAGGYGYNGGSANSNAGGNGGTSFIHASATTRTFLTNEGRYAGGDRPVTTGFTDFGEGQSGQQTEDGYVKLIFSN